MAEALTAVTGVHNSGGERMTSSTGRSGGSGGSGAGGPVARVLRRATRPPVLTLFAVLNLAGSGLIAFQHLRSVEGPRDEAGRLVTGDFLAFYTGGSLIREGRGAELYDLEEQYRHQAGMAAGRDAAGTSLVGWQPYVNPPLLAIVVAPLAALPYPMAYRAFGLAMLLALVGTFLLLRRGLDALARRRIAWWTAVLLMASWTPVFWTMAGGQNSVLTLFLLTGVCVAWGDGRLRLAGLFLGFLSYKPQFAILIGLALLARGAYAAVGVAAAVVAAHYAAGAVVVGPGWPLATLETLRAWGELETVNLWGDLSLLRVLERALPSSVAWPLAALGIGAVIAAVLWGGRRVRADDPRFPSFLGLLVVGTLIASPHLQYYDVAILALPVLLGVERILRMGERPSLGVRLALAVGFLGFPVYRLGDDLGVQPLVLWPIAVFLWHWNLLRREGSTDAGASRFAADGTPLEAGPAGPIRGGRPG